MKLTDHIHLIASGGMGISPAGDCNAYAVESRGDILLIDCGLSPDPAAILKNLEADGLDPRNIRGLLLTHVHPDHAGAVPAFQQMGIPVLCGEVSARVLRRGVAATYSLEVLPDEGTRRFFAGTPTAEADRILQPEERIPVGDLELRAHFIPAHTPDSVCYSLRIGDKLHLFTGDTLFYPGHINYFPGNLSRPEGYPQAIRTLAAMNPEGIYPGHAMFTIARGSNCTASALRAVEQGLLPPIKPYS